MMNQEEKTPDMPAANEASSLGNSDPSAAELLPIRIGISSCLLGEAVRFNGGHKRDRYLTETLGQYFEYVPVCPEVEVGLGVPRPTLRLQFHSSENVRLIMPQTGEDYTEKMARWAKTRIHALRELDLCGYVLKKNSPSCGLRVRTFYSDGRMAPWALGRFAAALMEAMPHLPVIEEGRLHDPQLRENWIEQVFGYHRLKQLWRSRWTIGKLVEFHTRHKFLLLAHSPKLYEELGRLVAHAKQINRQELRERYEAAFMKALSTMATRNKHCNVLHHMLGYFSDKLDKASRQELLGEIQDFRRGLVPLVVPLVLVRHYVRLFSVDYLRDQTYLNPHPKELALRSYVV